MAKRPKWVDKAKQAIPPMWRAVFSPELPAVERAYFLQRGWEPSVEHWIEAYEAIDKCGDKQPLLDLLKSEQEFPHIARAFLADLLARHQLKKSRGARRTPAYDQTDAEDLLQIATNETRALVKVGTRVEDALQQTSKSRAIPLATLASAYRGNRGSSRRMKKRRP